MIDKEITKRKGFCEICLEKDKLGIEWYDGEYTNQICFDCIKKAKTKK